MTQEEYSAWLLPYLQDQEIDTSQVEVYPCLCNGDKCKGWKWRFIKHLGKATPGINQIWEENPPKTFIDTIPTKEP